MSQEIVRRAEAGVSTISFNRVERKNSINGAIYAALAEALSAARVAVLQGSGRPFRYGLAVETA